MTGHFVGRSSYEGPARPTAPKMPVNAVYADSYRSEMTGTTDIATPVPHNPKSLRAHLQSLLPRHAVFHAQIEIQQISSVPLVHGEFAVRWKLKHLTTPPGSKNSLLGIVNPRRSGGTSPNSSRVDIKGKGKESELAEEEVDIEDDNESGSIYASSISPDGSSSLSSSGDDRPVMPSVVISSGASSSHSHSSSSTPPSFRPAARGQTPFLPLTEHSVTWSQSLSVYIKIPLSRDRENPDALMPNPAKFVVIQRVISGDPDAPQNPRLGAVYLDLSEYADPSLGEVTRRYLLRESKTNATLKLSIQLTHVGGEKAFVAPSLPKGEILNGVASLLENDVYRTRPRGFNIYGRQTRPYDLSELPLAYAYGPKTTEALIESLFNPL
ncbi:N-terminal C2 in EEIG1 and EHBP1 proteins-domain-containing protein, partial [Desarmillaria ectypa]